MKEIKFRAWDWVNNVMKQWEYVQRQFDFSCFDESDRFVMQQFTGLHDKNGKEGYHKDIAALGKKLYIIEWQQEEARFFLAPTGNNTGTWKFMDELNKMQIIGNLHENPDLLK